MSDYGNRSYGSGSDGSGWSGDDRRSSRYDDYSDYGDRGGYRDYGDYRPRDNGATAPVSGSPHEEPLTSGRARVPGSGDSGGSKARGSARVGDKNSAGLSEEEAANLAKNKKKRKRRRKLIALGCVMTMMLGLATVVGTLFFQSVDAPQDVDLGQSSTINFSDGSEMAKIGAETTNRKFVNVPPDDKADELKDEYSVPKHVKYALLATEDRGFYEHPGVDFAGVMRALWNNVTGGDTQGASTLTQQYVGAVEEIRDDQTYMRKANEAVMAMKLDSNEEKHKIIEHYLNLVYMGRGAYGLGAAVEAYFGKDQKVSELTASQAALIFAQIKSPSGTFDPKEGEENAERAEARWEYALGGMHEEGWLSKEKYKEAIDEGLPEPIDPEAAAGDEGMQKDTGFVSHSQVLAEAERKAGISETDLRTKGYEIETTINKELQEEAMAVADPKEGSAMGDADDNLRAGLVSVDPTNGEVVAYYGGSSNGSNIDKAKQMHPPGSAFKEFTLVAALDKGIGLESHWDGSSPREFPSRESESNPDGELRNSENNNEPRVTLRKTMEDSLNTSIYAITEEIGADKVVKTANALGIRKMSFEGEVLDFSDEKVMDQLEDGEDKEDVTDNEDRRPFDYDVGFGKFPVSVTDMASANATIANQGKYIEPHFIKSITNSEGEVIHSPEEGVGEKLTKRTAVAPEVAADAADVGKNIVPNAMNNNMLTNNQDFAGKSGTWERQCEDDPECNENSHIWYAGFTPKLSAAVWVGDEEDENGSVKHNGQPAFGSGLSGSVFADYMERATQHGKWQEAAPLPEKANHGDNNKGELALPEEGDDEEDGDEECDPVEDENCENPGEECRPGSPNYPECEEQQDPCEIDPNHPDCEDGGGEDCGGLGQPPCDDEGSCQPGEDCDGNGLPDSESTETTTYSTRPDSDAARETVIRSAEPASVSSSW